MKLGLGTVQFGLDYGVSNRAGKTSAEEVAKILDVAGRNGIRIIDTAALYGASEEVLGKVMPSSDTFDIVTKTPGFSQEIITMDDVSLLEDTFHGSLARLKQRSLYGLLVHRADDLLAEKGHLLFDKMEELKQQGLVKKIGVSVYTGRQIDRILMRFRIDLIQLPINVFDQRLIVSGHLSKLKDLGVEIHARSAFLQGLLVMDPDMVPAHFNPVREHLQAYHGEISARGLTPIQAALGFLAGLSEIDAIICGVNDHRQLQEICSGSTPLATESFAGFAIDDESVLNPSEWRV